MRRTACAFALFALAFFLVTAPSNAAPFTPLVERAYSVANHYWGGPPTNCTSLERVIVPDNFLVSPLVAEATVPREPEPCFLRISRSLAKPRNSGQLCAVMIHEDGHLHGLDHSNNPYNVMYPSIAHIPKVCWHFTLRTMNGG
jgi:Matrixin